MIGVQEIKGTAVAWFDPDADGVSITITSPSNTRPQIDFLISFSEWEALVHHVSPRGVHEDISGGPVAIIQGGAA